jgi:hypothetical protein
MPFVKRVRDYYKYGTEIDANVVGNFGRITDGIASGFNATNCLQVPEIIEVGSNTWERVIKISTGSDVNSEQTIWGASPDHQGLLLRIVDGSKLRLWLSTNGTSWDLANLVTSSLSISAYTTYYIKISFDGSQYLVDVSTDGISYTNYITFTSSTPIIYQRICMGCHNYTGSAFDTPFYGSIDLSKSYIKVGDDTVWDGTNYTKFGSWIDDGVVSGFTTSNWLSIPSIIAFDSNPWEIGLKFRTGDVVVQKQRIFNSQTDLNGTMFLIDANGNFEWRVNADNWVKHISSFIVSSNTLYWVKLKFDGSSYIMSYSTDDVTYVDDITIFSSNTLTTVGYNIGASEASVAREPFGGVIDLNNCYVKIGRSILWHGTKAYQINVSDKDVYENWKQPVLTSNNSNPGFIVSDSKNSSTYLCFDKDSSTGISPHTAAGSFSNKNYWVQMVSSNGLNVTNIAVTNRNISEAQAITAGSVQVSNNGYDWIKVTDWTNNNTGNAAVWNIPVSYEGYYKYIKLVITDGYSSQSGNWISVHGIALTATQLMPTGTIEDADYSISHNKLYQLAKKKRHYYKYDYRDYTLKNMTGYSAPEGSISQNISDDYYTSARYQLFWNREMHFNTKYPSGTVYVIYQFPNPLKTDTYNITMYGHTQNNNNVTARIYVQYTDGEELLLQEKLIQYGSTTSWNFNFTASKPIKRIGFHGVANPWNSANTVCTLGGFNIKSTTGNLQTYHGVYEVKVSDEVQLVDWEQPILTSNNSSKILTVSATNEGQGEAWKAFNGNKGNGWATANNVTSGTLTAILDKEILISSIEVTGLKNQYGSTNTMTIYSDVNKQNIIGEQKSFDYSTSDTLVWNFDEPVKASTLAFYGIGTTWVVIHDIKITAKETESVIKEPEDADYYIEGFEAHSPILKTGKHYVTLFESDKGGTYDVTIPKDCVARVTCVGGGGRATYQCRYDDRGYIWTGGSGAAYKGELAIPAGTYSVTVGSCASDGVRDTVIENIITVAGGSDGAGAGGVAPVISVESTNEQLNTAGNSGAYYASGNGGSGATWNYTGGASVYKNYGRGGGGKVCEYDWASSANEGSGEPFNPTDGYVKIEVFSISENQLF